MPEGGRQERSPESRWRCRRNGEGRSLGAEPDHRILVEELWDAGYVMEPTGGGECIYLSAGIETLTGYPAERWEAERLLWAEAIHGDDLDRALEGLDRPNPRTIEYR